MGNRQNVNKKPQQGSPKVPAQSPGGGPTGRSAVASDSDDRFASFFKSLLFLVLASVFIVLMIVAAWFLDQRRLEIVVLAVVLLAMTVGGVLWLRKKRTDQSEAQLLNETHDRRDYSSRPQEDLGSLITQAPPTPPLQASPGSASSESAALTELRKLKEAYWSLAEKVDGVDSRVAELERQLYYSPNPKPMEERRPVAVAPASPPPRRPATHNSYQEPRSHPIDLSSLNQAVCRFLADQTGNWEIERLVESVQRSMGGNASIDVEPLVPYSSGEWRLVALWPQRSQEGLVLVSSGGLVDDDIARYFDGVYGRRIIACKQPARVARGGAEVTVVQKGKVESS